MRFRGELLIRRVSSGFLDVALQEATPDHFSVSPTQRRIDLVTTPTPETKSRMPYALCFRDEC